ncbi:MAG: hypothetical protein ACRD96_05525, partial [Bryobacteraceae bacterium]
NAGLAAPEKFLLIPGEEVSSRYDKAPVHVNGFGLDRVVNPATGASLIATIQSNVNAIREAGGLPSVNHPNFGWAFASRELLAVENLNLFEVYNGHPTVNNEGGGGVESLDQMWDALLTAGRRIYGVAVDDAHYFKTIGKDLSNPGRGWVVVRAPTLSRASILAALRGGDFYSSTGVELSDVRAAGEELRVAIKPASPFRYTTEFIGDGGRVLARSGELTASYKLTASDKYVRAVVRASNGDDAWTQPLFR